MKKHNIMSRLYDKTKPEVLVQWSVPDLLFSEAFIVRLMIF